MTKDQQYSEYKNLGGSMTIEEWENDGRFNGYADTSPINISFTFTDLQLLKEAVKFQINCLTPGEEFAEVRQIKDAYEILLKKLNLAS